LRRACISRSGSAHPLGARSARAIFVALDGNGGSGPLAINSSRTRVASTCSPGPEGRRSVLVIHGDTVQVEWVDANASSTDVAIDDVDNKVYFLCAALLCSSTSDLLVYDRGARTFKGIALPDGSVSVQMLAFNHRTDTVFGGAGSTARAASS
jgi:hypothetical protein